ncbi:Protein SZT2 [Blattella germanica]|nr:Protein SZT2 [Blattella germanica]
MLIFQVLVQGWQVTQDNLGSFLNNVQQQLDQLENTVAEVAGIAYDQLEALRAESEKLVGGLFEESSDGEMVTPPAARVPMVGPDAGFVNMFRYGMLALRLLPESSCKNLIVVTDGVVASPDVNVLDSVLAQLRSGTVSCSFLHVGSPFHPHCCAGLVPYVDLMQFIADATCGAYLNVIPEVIPSTKKSMNIYHEKILTWRFQRGSLSLVPSDLSDMPTPPTINSGEWFVSNSCFYGSQEPHLLRKKQEENNLSTTLLSNINIRDSHVEVGLVLPWKNDIYIDYTVSCQWPPSSDCTVPGSGPVSVSGVSGPGLGPWVYTGSGIVHYSISIEAPYEFLHDITCLLKKPFKSPYRQAVVSRFWTTLKNLTRSDQLLVHLNSFPSNPATYTIPESIRSGMPVFYLSANSSSILSASDMTCPQFAQFWKPVCLLEPSVWKKWLHTHRIGLVLQHDRPLPRHLHLANSSGRFQVIQCRQAAAALYSLLKDWSTFVLIENHSYVKLIHKEAEKPPTSFYIIRVTSKPPCVVINVAFLNGTPGFDRYKIVQQLKNRIARLTFPQRPSAKEPPMRKLTSKAHSVAFSSQLLQEQQLQQPPQSQTQQGSPTQQQQPTRKWSDVSCCVLLHKPVEKILIRYERMPSDFGTVVFPDGTTPLAPGSQAKTRTAGGGLLTTLSRYLHHRRWVWAAQSGADAEEEAIARVLATITKMRLQEGFSFAHSTAGIINMVLEVQMKVPDVENDGELQIITECWIEPQHGLVVNCPPERDYMENLPYYKLADVKKMKPISLSIAIAVFHTKVFHNSNNLRIRVLEKLKKKNLEDTEKSKPISSKNNISIVVYFCFLFVFICGKKINIMIKFYLVKKISLKKFEVKMFACTCFPT